MNLPVALIEFSLANLLFGGFLFTFYVFFFVKNACVVISKDWPYLMLIFFICVYLLGLSLTRISSIIGTAPFFWYKIVFKIFHRFYPATGERPLLWFYETSINNRNHRPGWFLSGRIATQEGLRGAWNYSSRLYL